MTTCLHSLTHLIIKGNLRRNKELLALGSPTQNANCCRMTIVWHPSCNNYNLSKPSLTPLLTVTAPFIHMVHCHCHFPPPKWTYLLKTSWQLRHKIKFLNENLQFLCCAILSPFKTTIRDWRCIIRSTLMAAKIRTLYLNRSCGCGSGRGAVFLPHFVVRLDSGGNRTLVVCRNWGLAGDVFQRAEGSHMRLSRSVVLPTLTPLHPTKNYQVMNLKRFQTTRSLKHSYYSISSKTCYRWALLNFCITSKSFNIQSKNRYRSHS